MSSSDEVVPLARGPISHPGVHVRRRLAALACLGASLAACSPATLEVLDPSPDASVSGADASKQPTSGCLAIGQSCAFAGGCCSLACVATGADRSPRCAAGPACAVEGAACGTSTDCCSNLCSDGRCATAGPPPPPGAMGAPMRPPGPPGPPCMPAGESCGTGPDCCGGACTAKHCGLLAACRVGGEVCVFGSDCCSALCKLDGQPDAGKVGHCAELASCKTNDGMPCIRQIDEACNGPADCCSRQCGMTSDGVKRCLPGDGCSTECEACSQNADCCSGLCSPGPDGVARCQAVGACGADGEICRDDADCCGGPHSCAPDGAGPRRCRTPAAACDPAGATCGLAAECCDGGHCARAEGAFACAGSCSGDGNRMHVRCRLLQRDLRVRSPRIQPRLRPGALMASPVWRDSGQRVCSPRPSARQDADAGGEEMREPPKRLLKGPRRRPAG